MRQHARQVACGSQRRRRLQWVCLLRGNAPVCELAALFVDPVAIGTGCGRLLLLHILDAASARGFAQLVLDADPGAESFYLHFGASRIGTSPSGSVPGRELPHLHFNLDTIK